jgi:hypothetical protein
VGGGSAGCRFPLRRPSSGGVVTRRWLRGVVLLPVITLACGVPTDSQPRAIPDYRVPFGLLDPAPAPATVTIFLVAGNHLTPLPRSVPAPASPEKAIKALMAGVTEEERARGIGTAIAIAAAVVSTTVAETEARIEVTPAFLAGGPDEDILAVAQLVYTVTALPGLDRVAFSMGGRPLEVPRDDGTPSKGPFGRTDFSSVAHL